jgi:glycosyltransferase involved in cell wall biosynthesis
MKVAIDSGPLSGGHSVRGVGFYTRNLISSLGELSRTDKDLAVESFDFLEKKEELSKYDLIHYPYFDLFSLSLPLRKPTKTVVTVHDVIPLIYPERYPPGMRGRIKYQIQKHSLRGADAIITDTETSKKDIVRFLGVDEEAVFPIHLAPAESFGRIGERKKAEIRKKYDLPERFVLYVGDVNYNKNIPTLIRACKEIGTVVVIVGKKACDVNGIGVDLAALNGPKDWLRYLFGRSHPQLIHIEEIAEEFRMNEKIKRLGFLPGGDLVGLYNLASVYCQPSYYEGFGLPVLEAMACGCPVVCSRTQALVEIAGDAALFCDPGKAGGMAKALKKVISGGETSDDLRKKGLKKASEYSWELTARKTLQVYERVVAL